MKDSRRIVDGDDPWAAEVIGSALTDEPPAKSRVALLSALAGLGYASTTAAATGAAGTAATGAAGAAGAAATAKVAAGAGISLTVKWIGIAAVGVVVTSGVALSQWPESKGALSHHQSPVDTLRVQAAERVTKARAIGQPSHEPAQQAALPGDAVAAQKPETSKARSAASGTLRDPKPSLDEEIAHLDSARVALKSGNASGALAALDVHSRRFRGGAMAPEAEVMRMEALAAAGNKRAAVARARNFLRNDAKSPHAARVRALLQRIEP
jgi:predicted negative regulator of RcsB-dependent stress response